MSIDYTYQNAAFVSALEPIDVEKLSREIWINNNITTLMLGVRSVFNSDNSNLDYIIVFSNTISAAEQTELDSIIAAHTGKDPEPSQIDQLKEDSKTEIDNCAGEARDRYVTTTKAQDAVYVLKEKEAEKYKGNGYPADLTGYPFVQADKNARNFNTGQEAADDILTLATNWTYLAAQIEEIRLGYKDQIDQSNDPDTINALASKAKAILDSI